MTTLIDQVTYSTAHRGVALRIRGIIAATSEVTGVPVPFMLMRQKGPQTVSRARRIAMYVAKHQTHASNEEIADVFGRDPSNVSMAMRKVEREVEEDMDVLAWVNVVSKREGSFLDL